LNRVLTLFLSLAACSLLLFPSVSSSATAPFMSGTAQVDGVKLHYLTGGHGVARPGRMRAGWASFISFLQTAKDFVQLSKTRLTMPVLVIGGEKSLGEVLGAQMKLVASDVKVVALKDTGHWVLEERPQETTDALVMFL
jgi:pimeloyl-ACP methyl ester carboxylesterase